MNDKITKIMMFTMVVCATIGTIAVIGQAVDYHKIAKIATQSVG